MLRFTASALAVLALAVVGADARYDPIRMLCAVNKIRDQHGLSPLGLHPALTKAAQRHSEDQARRRKMTHTGSDGSQPSDRVERAGYDWKSVAENVAYGYDDQDECLDQWMRSPGHRKNILSKDSTHFGSAVAYAKNDSPYYTQDFAGDGRRHNYPICPRGYGGYEGDDYGSDRDDYDSYEPSYGSHGHDDYDSYAPSYGSYGHDDYESDRGDYDSYEPSYGSYGHDDYEPRYGSRGHDDYDSYAPSYGSYGHDDYESDRGDYDSYEPSYGSRGHDDYDSDRGDYGSYRPRYASRGHDDYDSYRPRYASSRDDKDCDSNKGRDSAYLVRRSAEPENASEHGMSHWELAADTVVLERRAPDHRDDGKHGESSWESDLA